MAESTSTLESIGKAVVIGARIAAIGYSIYDIWSTYPSNQSAQTPSNDNQKEQEEEKKQEPVQYQLDPTQDIESLTCPITMETV